MYKYRIALTGSGYAVNNCDGMGFVPLAEVNLTAFNIQHCTGTLRIMGAGVDNHVGFD